MADRLRVKGERLSIKVEKSGDTKKYIGSSPSGWSHEADNPDEVRTKYREHLEAKVAERTERLHRTHAWYVADGEKIIHGPVWSKKKAKAHVSTQKVAKYGYHTGRVRDGFYELSTGPGGEVKFYVATRANMISQGNYTDKDFDKFESAKSK